MASDKRHTKARGGAQRLTACMVGSLPPGDHTDPAVSGLQMRVRASGTRSWVFRFAWRGANVRLTIGHYPRMSLVDARERAQELRRALDDGIDPRRARPRRQPAAAPVPLFEGLAPDDRHSVEYLVHDFMSRYAREHMRRPEQAEAILRREVLGAWRGRDARTITPEEVLDLLDGIVERGAKVAANRCASLLARLFRFGIQRRIVSTTPVQLLIPPGGREKPRERTLSDEELQAFLKDPCACAHPAVMAHLIMVLLLTGQRRGELVRATWRQIDLERRTWLIPAANSKTGRAHLVPLSPWAVEEFLQLHKFARGSRWVMPGDDEERHLTPARASIWLLRSLDRFAVAGIRQAFTLHDLRRTCRTGLGRLRPKVEPHIAELILNHKQSGIAGVYDLGEYLDEKRDALDRWAAHLEQLKAMGARKQ